MLHQVSETDLKIASKGFVEELRFDAQDELVSVVLPHLAIARCLINDHIGEESVVIEPESNVRDLSCFRNCTVEMRLRGS